MFIAGWWLYDLQNQWRWLVEYHYGWLAALLAAYLAWERWETRPLDDHPVPRWKSALLVVVGAPLVLVAELYKQAVASTPASSFTLSIGCTLFLLANVLCLRGPSTARHFLFPLLFLFVAVPLPKVIWNPIVLSLQQLIASLNVQTLNLLGIPAVQQASVIRLGNCLVGVDEACSGVRSLQASLMAGLFIGALAVSRRSLRWFLVGAGMLLALFGNYLRSLFLALAAYRGGAEGVTGVHDVAGWGILIFTAAGLAGAAWLAMRWEKEVGQLAPPAGG